MDSMEHFLRLCKATWVIASSRYNWITTTFRFLNSGIPQGSILGLLLFNVYINNIVKIDENTQFIAYADDASFFFLGSDLLEIRTRANNVFAELHAWSMSKSLNINTSKTKAVLFRAKTKEVNFDLVLFLDTSEIGSGSCCQMFAMPFNENMAGFTVWFYLFQPFLHGWYTIVHAFSFAWKCKTVLV